jgi:hypothetical protein
MHATRVGPILKASEKTTIMDTETTRTEMKTAKNLPLVISHPSFMMHAIVEP